MLKIRKKPLKTIKALGTKSSIMLLDVRRLKNPMDLDFKNTNARENLISKSNKIKKLQKPKPGMNHYLKPVEALLLLSMKFKKI